jgi:Toprim domain-containing protein
MSRCGTAFLGDRRDFAIDVDLVKARANDRVRELAAELLPNGREDSGYWRTGSIADEPGQSLAVTLQGPERGMWCDYAASGPEGGGNIIQLAAQVLFGGNFGKAFAWMKSRLGLDDLDPERLRKERARAVARVKEEERSAAAKAEKMRRLAHSLFLAAAPIGGTPAEAYLRGRGIDFERLGRIPRSLGFHPEVYCKEVERKLPCLVAAAVDLDGRHIATHRTWLAPDGKGGWTKADLEDPKMTIGRSAGGFIPLWKGACRKSMKEIDPGTDVYVSEGIEDGLTVAMAKPSARVICAIALRKIPHLRLPELIGRLIIVGQRDTHPRTLAALEAAIASQQELGRDVWLTPPPAGGFKDVNEALQAERGMAA